MTRTEQLLGCWSKIPRRPFLQATQVPQAPVKHDFFNGIKMNGVFPYRRTTVTWYDSPRGDVSIPIQAKPLVPPIKIFVGVAPDRGIYTGVRNGRY